MTSTEKTNRIENLKAWSLENISKAKQATAEGRHNDAAVLYGEASNFALHICGLQS